MTKRSIDAQVAGLLGIHQSQVSLITTTFLRLAGRAVAQRGRLYLEGLGEFTRNDLKVGFRKGAALHRTLKETPMEKYGVDEGVEQDVLEKAASQGCPECGAKCEKHGNTLVCPNHGTAPFEKKSK